MFFLLLGCQTVPDVSPVEDHQKVFVLGNSAFVSNGILNFNSTTAYVDLIEKADQRQKELIVKNLDALADYRSIKSVFKAAKKSTASRKLSTQEEEMAISNDFISTLLNADGMIRIGDYFFKINLANERCLVLHKDQTDQLLDLSNEDNTNKNIMVFSVSDDVLDLLQQGTKGTINGRTELFCNDRRASGKEKLALINYSDDYAGYDYRVDAKHVYQEAAIYFSLLKELKHMSRSQSASSTATWSQESTEIDLWYYFKWKQRCIRVIM